MRRRVQTAVLGSLSPLFRALLCLQKEVPRKALQRVLHTLFQRFTAGETTRDQEDALRSMEALGAGTFAV